MRRVTRSRSAQLVVLLVCLCVVFPASAMPVSAAGPTTVSLSPTSSTVAPGATTTYDVVVENASGGVGAYTFNISVQDPSVGEITDVSLGGSPGLTNIDFSEDNSSVDVQAALANTADTGEVN